MTIHSCVLKEHVEYMLVFKGQVTALDFLMARFVWQLYYSYYMYMGSSQDIDNLDMLTAILELGLDVLLIALGKPEQTFAWCWVHRILPRQWTKHCTTSIQFKMRFQQFWDSTFKRFHETHDLVRWHYLRSTYLPWHTNPSTLCWPGDRGFHRLQCFLDLFEILFLVSTTVQYHLGICMPFVFNRIWFDLFFPSPVDLKQNLRPLVTLRCIWPLSCTIHRHL